MNSNESELIPNVLVVDDNPNNIFAMRSILESMPIKIFEATSGNKALQLLLQEEFALVLLDVQMPEMDGFEVASLMQQNKKTQDISIIFVTANNKDEQYVKQGLEIGAVDYLYKPIDPIILQKKITIFLQYYLQKKQMEEKMRKLNASQSALSEKNKTLVELARTDALTGLENRLNFEEKLIYSIKEAAQMNRQFALLYLDLDNFKMINDTLGHDVGDMLLIEVANRLRSGIRSNDTFYAKKDDLNSVSRLGGDEFAMIIERINNLNDANIVSKRIIDLLSVPFHLAQHTVNISASIGIAHYPNDGLTPEELKKNADVAMYHAKKRGKNQFQRFSEVDL